MKVRKQRHFIFPLSFQRTNLQMRSELDLNCLLSIDWDTSFTSCIFFSTSPFNRSWKNESVLLCYDNAQGKQKPLCQRQCQNVCIVAEWRGQDRTVKWPHGAPAKKKAGFCSSTSWWKPWLWSGLSGFRLGKHRVTTKSKNASGFCIYHSEGNEFLQFLPITDMWESVYQEITDLWPGLVTLRSVTWEQDSLFLWC